MALPNAGFGNNEDLAGEDSSNSNNNEFWNSIRNIEYGDYLDEDEENKLSKLKLNSILFAVFQVLLVLIFFRAIGSIDNTKFGYTYLKELSENVRSSLP